MKNTMTNFRLNISKNFLLALTIFSIMFFSNNARSQCFQAPTYCTNITAANNASYGMGIQNVSLGYSASNYLINNTTGLGNGTQIYFNYTNLIDTAYAGSTVYYSIKGGNSNQTQVRIYIDWNNDGTFNTTAPELVATLPNMTVANTVTTGTFVVPSGTPNGTYRVRIASDGQGIIPLPCGPTTYSADYEDYTLLVPASSIDVMSSLFTSPSFFIAGNNTIGFSFTNVSSTTLTSINIGYQLNSGTPITQSLTGLSVAPGATYTATFTSPLNISTIGTFNLKAWQTNPNGAGSVTPANDTICRTVVTYCSGALSGSYTIDPAGSGSTNFPRFGAADSAMMACGISGPVVFNVAAGTYNEQVYLSSITGVSSTNTITFTGGAGNTSTRILTYSANSGAPYTVRLDGANYVTFRNLTIRGTSATDAWVVHFLNGTNNRVTNCVVEITGTGATATTSNLVPIVVNGSATSISTVTTLANNISIDSSTLNAGYYSIYCTMSTSSNVLTIFSDSINNAYQYAYYSINTFSPRIRANVFNIRTSSTSNYGIYLQSCNNSGADYFEISRNKIINAGMYAMYLNSCSNNGTATNQIYNNMIGGGFRYTSGATGIYLTSCTKTNIYHNSVNMDVAATSGTTAALYIANGSANDVRNNHLAISNTTAFGAYCLWLSSSTVVSNLDYNNYFNRSTTVLLNISGTNYTGTNYRAALPNGGGNYSISLDPLFISNTNLHTTNGCNRGANLSVPIDFDGDTRTSSPNIGADELATLANNDIGVLKINSPNFPLTTGSQSINVTLKNYGGNTLTAASINYAVNGGTPYAQTWYGTLSPCDTVNFTFSVPYTFTAGLTNLKVYTSYPNGSTDANLNNDTNQFTLSPALSGTYTINPSGTGSSNFVSFGAADSALMNGGIFAPVTFYVYTGTYTEQITLPSTINGVSLTNSITFQSLTGNASNVILTYNSTIAANNYTLRLSGINNVKFRNMTISATNINYGTALTLINGASNDSFYNVVFNGVVTTSNTTNQAVIYSPSSSVSSFIYFDTCRVNNGAYGSYFQSTGNTTLGSSSQDLSFNNCDFSNQYAYGLYNSNLEGLRLTRNRITTNSTLASYYGMYNYWITINADANRPIINGNKITGALGGYGMYNYYFGVNSTITTPRRPLIANNMIQIGSSTNATYGIYDMYSNGADYINNSVNIGCTQTANTSAAAYFASAAYGGSVVLNNIFAAYNGAPAMRMDNVSMYPTCDYNDLYSTGTNLAYLSATASTTLAGWRTSSSRDANSVSVIPNFVSTTDLHISTSYNVKSITASPLVLNDYDNSARCAITDIGADHHPANNNIGVSSVLYPYGGVAGAGARDLKVYIRNYGSNPVTSANIKYTDYTTIRTITWSGNLNPCDSVLITFTGANQYYFTGTWSLKFYTDSPNTVIDSDLSNDTIQTSGCTGLAGAYTINPSGSGSSNYTSFTAALAAMQSCGVGGPVVFSVSAATYAEQLSISNINGTSLINTITFDGGTGNASTRILAYPTTNALPYVVRFNNCKFIIFRNMTIRSTGTTDAWVANFLDGNNNKLNNCVVEITGTGATSTASNIAPIVVNGSATTMGTASTLSNNNMVDSCVLNAGYYSVYATISASPNTFIVNASTLNSAYQYGVYGINTFALRLRSNTFNLRTSNTTNQAVYLQSLNNTGTDYFEISGNKIYSFGSYGLYLNSCSNSGSAYNTIFNNMIGGGVRSTSGSYGMYLTSCSRTQIFHNSINIDAPTSGGTNAAMYIINGGTNDVRNNHCAITNANVVGAYPLYISPATAVTTCDYNNYFNRAGTTVMNIAGTNYVSSTYRNSFPSGGGSNSNNTNPSFISSSDLHVNDACNNGILISSVLTDFDGQTRNNPPDIGADEVSTFNNDAGTVSIAPFTAGLQNVKVLIKNYGSNTLTSSTVSYSVNGGTPKIVSWSGSLAPCDTTTVTFSGTNQFNFTLGTSYTIVAYTSNPNTSTDPKTANDTVTFGPSCTMLSGNYTINPSGSGATNFTTFAAAANALSCGGVSTPVIFNITSATYNEQFTITNIPGASTVNTVTFQGDTSSAPTISFSPTVNTEPHTIRLNNAQFVSFRNLIIQNSGANFGVGIHIMGNSNYTKVKNCTIQLTGSAATSTSSYYIPVLLNNYNDIYSVTSIGTQVSNVEIDSNRMVNGYYGVYVYSATGTPYANNVQLRKNTIDSSYYYGVYYYYNDGLTFSNNTVNMRVNGSVNSIGLYINNCFAQGSNIHSIIGNKIINAGQYGMYLYQSYNSTSTYRSKLINNMIGGGFRINTAIAVNCMYLNYWDIWNNTANLDFPVSSAAYSAMFISNGSSQDVRNNILMNSATTGSGVSFNVTPSTVVSALDYNDYVNLTGSNLLYIGASALTSSNFIGGGGFNANSRNQNPGFVSATNLHIGSACVNGIAITSITTDIDGQTRNTPPDMGADEFTGVVNNDIGVSFLIAPVSPFAAGSQDVKVRISNYGANTITSATIKYSVNGGVPKSYSWSGTLLPCDTTSVTFTGTNQFNFAFGNSYSIKAYTEQPNAASDANKNNDTIVSTVCPSFSGVFTIDPAGSGTSNFTSFTAAANAINCGGLNGPVTFVVASGTYNEQFILNSVSGASATNTITFRSATNNAANVQLNYTSTGTSDNYVATLNGCSYVRFANITFNNLGVNFGNVIVITNSANYNTLDSCVFNGLGTSSATTNLALIYSSGTKDNYNTISNCTFNNGAMGIFWSSNSSSYAAGNVILKNTFNNQYYTAIYTQYHDYLRVKQNYINTSTGYTNYYGIYSYMTYNTSGASEITKNKIIATIAGGYGINCYYANWGSSSTNRFLVANNMIQINTTSTSTSYGIANQYAYYIDILHNTVNVSAQPTGTSYAFYDYYFYSTTCLVENNVFVNSTVGAGATSFAVYEYLNNAGTWNNNNYYSTGTNLGQWNNVSKATMALWRAAGSQDALSFNKQPIFVSSTDLHFYNLPCINNAGANVLARVPDDYDGTARTITPDIGATEFTPVTLDASAIAVRAPSGALTISTSYNVVVTVTNQGTSTITSLVVGYRVNGGTPLTQTLSSLTLLPCDTMQVTFSATSGPGSTDQRYLAIAGFAGIKAFTASPNSSSDLNTSNDTTIVTFCTPFSGTFTIDGTQAPSSTNFQSFTAAKNALTSCGGIIGPVVFNVAAGTYNEQIDFTSVSGSSATNTITFDGGTGNAATRILTFNAAASNSLHTLRMNNTQYITVRNITIRGASGSYGWPLHILGSSSNIKIKNCIIDFVGSGLTATNDNFDPIVINNYAASASPTSGIFTGSNIEIDSNRVLGGNASIYIYGNGANTGIYFRNNKADSAYTYGVYAYNLTSMKLNNNSISMSNSGSINSYGLYLNSCNAATSTFHEVSGNKVINCGLYGIYLSGSNGQASPRSQMFNNAIGGGFRNTNPSGIYFASSSYNWDVYQNSVNMDNQASGTNSAALYVGQCCTTGSTLLDVRNNIFAVSAVGSSSYPIYFSNGTAYAVKSTAAWNYNMYYKAGISNTQPFLYVAGNQTIANFIGNGGYNTNSISQNPNFVNMKDLHVYDGCFNGDSLGVTIDLEGNTRASFADRGAYEVQAHTDDIGAKVLLQPSVPITSGLQNISVIIKNYGSNTVYNGTVKYSVNGATPVSLTFTDTITPCDTSLVTFSGSNQYNFVGGNTYTIKVFTQFPNGNLDSSRANDTITVGPICLGMSGAYTINASGSGSSNFTSFTNAVNAMLCGGVSGPTTFTVASGTYNEQITIPAIPGASLSNPIIFDGGAGNASTRILVNSTTAQSTPHTLRMTGASFIQIRNLTIRNSGSTYAWPIHLMGLCNNIKIKNNIIEITGAGATGVNTNFVPVVMSGAPNSATTNAQQDSIEVDSNIINGGYASVWDYNSSGTANRFRGNTLNNPIYYGLYIYNSTEVKAKNNTINMSPTGNIASVGIYLYSCYPTGSMMHEISANKIFDMGQYGIWSYFSNGLSANPSQMVNNVIGGGFRNTTSHYGIAVDYGSYYNIWFNSINSDTATSSSSGNINLNNSSSINVRNNIMQVSAIGSQQLPFYAATTTNVSTLDYNNYYKVGSFTSLIYVGASYGANNFIGGGGYNTNAFSRNPYFVSKKDLHIGNACNNGVTISAITTDIEGNIRNTPPDVGAYEMIGGVANNLGVISIVSPSIPFASGPQNVSVIVANLGNNLVTSYNVSYSVNGGTPYTLSLSDSILPCDTSLITFTGSNQYNFVGGPFTIKAYSFMPNGLNDANHFDDTTTVGPVCSAMNGTYTINPSGSGLTNFVSFNAAVSALQCGGISGNVTFNISNGTYNEQVDIGNISGVNDTMRVTFMGASTAGTILTYAAGTSSSAHTLRLNNSPYVNFYNMTINATGSTYGTAVQILGASNFAKVKRCVIAVTGAAANGTSSYFIPLLINNSTDITNPSLNGTMVNNIEIDSNRIVAGYYGIYLYGRTSTPYTNNNKFRRNAIDSSYYYGVYAYYADAFKFLNNVVNMRANGSVSSVGLYLTQCYTTGTNYHDVSNNRINSAGQYGVYTYFTGNSTSYHGKFVNNMIGGGFRSSTACGLYWQYSDYWDMFHNTVVLDYPTTSNSYAAANLYNFANYNLDIRNNIFAYTATSGSGIPFYLSGTSTISTFNYNNLYNASAINLEYINGSTYTTSSYSGGSGYNSNSVTTSTSFVSAINPHLTASANSGVVISSVPNDIDGEVRNSPPEIGADEYYSSMDIGVLSIDSPTTVTFCGRSRNIYVRLKNYGNQSITIANLNVYINGALVSIYPWTGTLAYGATSSPINIGAFAFTGGAYTLAVYTSAPNGGTDVNNSNDTASIAFSVTPSVTPTITISTPNTSVCTGTNVTFTAAYTGGGPVPAFQWRKNGITVGTNDTFYTSGSLANNDSIVCLLTSTVNCASPSIVVSNAIKMNVGTTLPPSIAITAVSSNVCPGQTVSLSSTATNGGSSPHYQWVKNGSFVGTDTSLYSYTPPANNDSIRCILTSSLSCASKPRDTSNFIKITVNPFLTPTASITASLTTICSGVNDTFTASIGNGGTAPNFQWMKNSGTAIGSNSNILVTSTLNNHDSVYLVLTSNATCANPVNVSSNKIAVIVNPSVQPTAAITASKNSLCTGDSVTFRATTTNGGTSPIKQWMKNGVPLVSGIDSFTTSLLSNLDTIYLVYTSNATCALPSVVTSNTQLITINSYVVPSVTVSANNTSICSGTSVQFNALGLNGGSLPHYTWKRNNVTVGNDSIRFTTSSLSNNDSVYVILTSNAACATKPRDTAQAVKLTVNNIVFPSVSINANTTSFCLGVPVTFNSTPLFGGTSPSYQWKKNGVNVGTDTSVFIASSFIDKDTVSLTMISNASCLAVTSANSNKVILNVVSPVSASVSISPSTNYVCYGTPITFSVSSVNAGTTPIYQWKINGANTGSNTSTFISAALNNLDTVQLEMTSSIACAIPATALSNRVGMRIAPSVTPKVVVSQSTTNVCSGSSVTFTALDSNGGLVPVHRWYVNGIASGTDSINFTTNVAYGNNIVCVLQSNANCKSKTYDTATSNIVIKPAPVKPVISRSFDTLTSTISSGYQWYLNYGIISGATSRKYKVTQNGTYVVTVDSLGCFNTSNPLTLTNVGIRNVLSNDFISIAPNPTNNSVLLNAQFATNDETSVTVFDMAGRQLIEISKGKVNTLNDELIDLSNYRSGIYMVIVKHGDAISNRKIVKAD